MFNKYDGVKMKKILIVLALVFVLVLPLALADYKCYTMVTEDDNVIQINPKQSEFKDIGRIVLDYFEPQPSGSKYQYVKVYFTAEDLRDDKPLNFSVVCAGDNQTITFERTITPTYKSAEEFIEQTSWLKDNAGFAVIGIVGLILIFTILGILIARLRGR